MHHHLKCHLGPKECQTRGEVVVEEAAEEGVGGEVVVVVVVGATIKGTTRRRAHQVEWEVTKWMECTLVTREKEVITRVAADKEGEADGTTRGEEGGFKVLVGRVGAIKGVAIMVVEAIVVATEGRDMVMAVTEDMVVMEDKDMGEGVMEEKGIMDRDMGEEAMPNKGTKGETREDTDMGEVDATGVVEEAIIEAEEEGAIDLAGSFLRSTCVILQFSYACCAVTKKSLSRERCIYQNAITLLEFSLLPCSVCER